MKWLLLFISWTCFAQLPTVPDATSAKNAAFTPSSISGLAYAWYEADATNTSSGGLITGNWNDRIQNLPSNQG